MLNMVTIVGRIMHIDTARKCVHVRIFGIDKNKYKDIIVTARDNMMDNIQEHCEVYDLIGVKGALSLKDIDTIEAEKVTFLSRPKITESDIDDKGGD